jgi:hypothetical protein
MQSGVKPKATSSDFVVIPSDQVRVAPSDAEISDLLRAAARQHSEAGGQAADSDAPVPAVDATFRASAVNDDVPGRKSLLRRGAMRLVTALLVALGIGGAALTWQTFGFAAKKALFTWAPKWAIAASIPLDKLGLGPEAKPSDEPAEAAPASATADASDAATSATAAATAPSDSAQQSQSPQLQSPQLQSMARDLASANQEIETLKASIAELKASQQQMAHDLAKTTDKLAEQSAKAKLAAAAPRPPQAPHKPAPPYAPSASYAPASTPAPAPTAAYRPAPPSYSAQASMAQPPAAAQPVPLQPQADPGIVGSAPRPPMPVQ